MQEHIILSTSEKKTSQVAKAIDYIIGRAESALELKHFNIVEAELKKATYLLNKWSEFFQSNGIKSDLENSLTESDFKKLFKDLSYSKKSVIRIYGKLSNSYLKDSMPEKALEIAEIYNILDNGISAGYGHKCSALNALGRYEEALKISNDRLEVEPNDAYFYSHKCTALNGLGKYEEALEISNKLIEIEPNDAYFYSHKCTALNGLRRYEEALEVAEMHIKVAPNNPIGYSHKCTALNGLCRYEEALKISNERLEVEPNDAYFYSHKCTALNGLGKYEEALEISNKLIEIEPNNPIFYAQKCICLNGLCRHEEALKISNERLEIEPNNPIFYGYKCTALNGLRRYEEALEVAEMHIKVAPNNPIGFSHKCTALNGLGRYEEGLKISSERTENEPNNPIGYGQKFICEIKLQNYKAAEETLKDLSGKVQSEDYVLGGKIILALIKGDGKTALDTVRGVIQGAAEYKDYAMKYYKRLLDYGAGDQLDRSYYSNFLNFAKEQGLVNDIQHKNFQLSQKPIGTIRDLSDKILLEMSNPVSRDKSYMYSSGNYMHDSAYVAPINRQAYNEMGDKPFSAHTAGASGYKGNQR